MGRHDYAYCRECGGHRDDVGTLSYTRLCNGCGKRLLAENIDGLHGKTGAPWARWRFAMAACVGATLPSSTLDGSRGAP